MYVMVKLNATSNKDFQGNREENSYYGQHRSLIQTLNQRFIFLKMCLPLSL